MDTVRHSLCRLWVAVAAIAGSMMAMAGASAGGPIPNPRSAALQGATCKGSIAAADDMPAPNNRRDATAEHRSAPVAGHFCFEPNTALCTGRSRALAAPSLEAGYALEQPRHTQAETPARAVHLPRLRVTRLQNGSILCCRDRPRAHIVAMSLNGNDDTASDGDESSDDDDSQDDQNGDDDSEPQIFAWIPATFLYVVAPARKATTSWIVPSFHPFLMVQRLRC
jgi:hypothetical protein